MRQITSAFYLCQLTRLRLYSSMLNSIPVKLSKRLFCVVAIVMCFSFPSASSATTIVKPFSMPFAGPASYTTWHVSQMYGNTKIAHMQRHSVYDEGQGLHFGIDFAAECGEPVLAIGDGTVFSVDGPWGSWPHNVVVYHGNDVYSVYGHLRIRSTHLIVGQTIARGDVVGLNGDWQDPEHCSVSPHLHLEIRTNSMREAVNPVDYIDANWDDSTLGITGHPFEIDVNNLGRWQSIYDQPNIRFGGPILNNYHQRWIE